VPADTLGGPERPAALIVARATAPAGEAVQLEEGQASRPVAEASFVPAAVDQERRDANSGPERRDPDPDPAGQAVAAAVEPVPVFDPARSSGCTSPQLRRFIKSRAYIPMHELRRRFAIEGHEDDVVGIDVEGSRLYVGLPEREGRLLGELLRGGDVGAELSHDPVTPMIVGVYPMRPVPRS
jgi:hypothetical protein